MKKKGFSAEQVIGKLREAEVLETLPPKTCPYLPLGGFLPTIVAYKVEAFTY
jgi:hypothetical protein